MARALGLTEEARAKTEGVGERATPREVKAATSKKGVASSEGLDAEAAWVRSLAQVAKKNAAAHEGASAASHAKPLSASSPLFLGHLGAASEPEAKHVPLKHAWRELGRALAGATGDADALSPAALDALLSELGYALERPVSGDHVVYRRGDSALSIEPSHVGHVPTLRLKLEGRHHDEAKSLSGVAVAGALIPKKLWKVLEARYREVLDQFVAAVHATRGRNLPTDMDTLKRFVFRGLDAEEKAQEAEEKAELASKLDDLTKTLEALKDDGKAPKGIIIYVCGPDGAGKSSTGEIVMHALEAAGYAPRKDTFKAPSEEERRHFWLDRFQRGVPAEGEAFFWDRGPAGDAVYGNVDRATAKRMARELGAFEGDLRDRGILMVKIELHAEPKKQAATFGKRLARQLIADKLEDALRARGHLDPEAHDGLESIGHKIDGADFRALARYPEIQARYERFMPLTEQHAKWLAIDATHRHDARLAIIRGVEKELERFADR